MRCRFQSPLIYGTAKLWYGQAPEFSAGCVKTTPATVLLESGAVTILVIWAYKLNDIPRTCCKGKVKVKPSHHLILGALPFNFYKKEANDHAALHNYSKAKH